MSLAQDGAPDSSCRANLRRYVEACERQGFHVYHCDWRDALPRDPALLKWERASAPIAQERVRRGAKEECRDIWRTRESASHHPRIRAFFRTLLGQNCTFIYVSRNRFVMR